MNLRSPSTLVAAWALVPLLVAVASASLGWALGVLSGIRLGSLTVPAGFCAGIALMTFCLTLGFSGKLTVWLAAACALACAIAWLARVRRDGWPDVPRSVWLWPAGAALFAYLVGLAPVVGTGHSAILGYVLNNDSSAHISLIEALARGGAHATQVNADSFHNATIDLGSGYPLGSYPWPLFGRVVTGVDVFHLWSPLSAVVLGLIALVVYDILRTLDMPRWGAAVAGSLTALGHLVYAYHAQGGTKEVVLPLAVYATVAMVARAFDQGLPLRSLLPAGVGAIAATADIGYAGLAWLGPAALVALVALVWRARSTGSYGRLWALAPLAVLCAAVGLPVTLRSVNFFSAASGVVSNPFAVGNLFFPIGLNRTLNVWLAHDYRFPKADAPLPTDIGIWLALAAAVAGGVYALWRRNLAIVLALVAGWGGVALIEPKASIYFDAKTLVALAPAIGIATAAGVFWLTRSGHVGRVLGLAAAGLLAAGVVASDAYIYSGVWNTPLQRFQELARIDHRFSGQGPMLVDEREFFSMYLLRDTRPWVEYGFRYPFNGFRTARPPNFTPDPDIYQLAHIETFPLLLERDQPFPSRPPANFTLVYTTQHYRVYRREGAGPRAHVPLGVFGYSGSFPVSCVGGRPRDRSVRDVASEARRLRAPLRVQLDSGHVAGVLGVSNFVDFKLGPTPTAPGIAPVFGGSAAGEMKLRPGKYVAWIQGGLAGGFGLYTHPASGAGFTLSGTAKNDLGLPDQWNRIQVVDVRGRRTVVLLVALGRPWWKTGSRHYNLVGPVVFVPAHPRRRLVDVDPRRVGSLCGRPVDWIEIPPARS